MTIDGTEKSGDKRPDKGFDAAGPAKRRRGALADNELLAFSNITNAVKDVAQAIRDNKPTDMHPDLYNAVMTVVGFSDEALMAALGHLVDHKAQGTVFVGMNEPHMVLGLRTYLSEYCY